MTHTTRSADPTVLLVDDEVALADSLALWLDADYDVRVAYSGRDALDAFDETVDLVFLDRNLPSVSGREVLEEIRRRNESASVVMVTASPREDLSDLPADDVLTKPVSRDDVVSAVERHLPESTGAPLD